MMKHGRSTYNAGLVFTAPGGAILQCQSYAGAAFTSAQPLLVRFHGGETAVLTSGLLQLNLDNSFSLRDNEGYEWIYVGFQKLTDTTVQLCAAILADSAVSVTTVASPTVASRNQVLAPTVATGPITWFAKLAGMRRVGGVWDSTEAQIVFYE